MPSPSPRRQQARFDPNRGSAAPEMIDLVDASWIVKALATMFLLAVICGHITLCVLFSHAQWQLVLHPSRTVASTPASLNLSFIEVHFGVDSSGQPQLDGWWIPSDNPSDPTGLLLHSGEGSIANALPLAQTLHNARLNVFLFDYRGFGRSGAQHPTQSLMQADAESALTYLTQTRNLPPASILIAGTGLGASLAVKLCANHPQIPALILISPDGDLAPRASADVRSKLVPVHLLFSQDFPLAAPLHLLPTPKLLITPTNGPIPATLQQAANPKTTVELPLENETALHEALTRFISAYLPQPPAILAPNP